MLKNNLLYKDNYMYFVFNGIHSNTYNLMIQNGADDFKIITNENTSIDYVSPKYQNGRYMMGVTRSHRTIPHKLVAYGLTRAEANDMANWLRVGNYGPLIYDFAPDWQYNVAIGKLSDMTLYPIDIKHFIVSFDITFETIEGTDAENVVDALILNWEPNEIMTYAAQNEKCIPAIGIQKKDTQIELYIFHIGNGQTLLDLDFNCTNNEDLTTLTIVSEAGDKKVELKCKPIKDTDLISYKSRNHLMFLNGQLFETNFNLTDLKIDYSDEAISFQSPGSVQHIGTYNNTNKNDIINKLQEKINTSFNYFILQVSPLSAENIAEYYKQNGTYPYYQFTNGNIQINIDYNPEISSSYPLNEGRDIYFGYYDKIIISANANALESIDVRVTQFNNLLSEFGDIT